MSDASTIRRRAALLLNKLVLAAHAQGYQHASPETAFDDRITDADLEKLEQQILTLLDASSGSQGEQKTDQESSS